MIKNLVILFGVLFAQQALAEPSPQIAKMIQTPATAFDMFLFRLYEAAKCNNVLKNSNSDEADLCLSSIKYDADTNVLSTFFRVLPATEAMEDFVDQDTDGRKQIMLKLLDNTVRRVGALDSWGLLHSTPISHGWKGGTAMAIATSSLWIASFLLVILFPILNNALGAHGTFWLFSGICFLGFLFILKRLPETKGKTLEEMENLLIKKEK